MKFRNGFVSNSSSSSFVIDKDYLSFYQCACINDIKNVVEFWKSLKNEDGEKINLENLGSTDEKDIFDWTITHNNTDNTIECSTHMTNFDLDEFLRMIGVPECAISNRRD